MKIYILTCVNADSELVRCKAYGTRELAWREMMTSAMAEFSELADLKRSGLYFNNGDNFAAVGDVEECYLYTITEDKI